MESDQKLLEKIRDIFELTQRVELSRVARNLGISEDDLFQKLIIWRKSFNLHFRVDGSLLIVENLEDFKNALDRILRKENVKASNDIDPLLGGSIELEKFEKPKKSQPIQDFDSLLGGPLESEKPKKPKPAQDFDPLLGGPLESEKPKKSKPAQDFDPLLGGPVKIDQPNKKEGISNTNASKQDDFLSLFELQIDKKPIKKKNVTNPILTNDFWEHTKIMPADNGPNPDLVNPQEILKKTEPPSLSQYYIDLSIPPSEIDFLMQFEPNIHPIPDVNRMEWNTFGLILSESNQIVELGLYQKNLNILPDKISNLIHLQRLFLRDNKLTELPEQIGKLENLESLDLRNNHLSKLPNPLWKLQNLKKLELGGNPIADIPDDISKLENLVYLGLGGLKLSHIPQSINKLKHLKHLNVSVNNLETFPSTFTNFKTLEILVMSDNKLNEFPEILCTFQNLTILDLRNNKMPSIPENISNLTNLVELYLQGNQIKNIPSGLKNLKKLKKLNVYANPILLSSAESQEVFTVLTENGCKISK